MYAGKKITIERLQTGVVELVFNAQDIAVNTFNTETLRELKNAVEIINNSKDIHGCLISSLKPAFIVGADIFEFKNCFSQSESDLKKWVMATHDIFGMLESLPFPTVSAINGMALGGGFELALATDFRVAAADARVGLPEVNLGICPGWGGTVRLSRLVGLEAACEWMLSGKARKAAEAQALGVIDQVAVADELRAEALRVLAKAMAGEMDYLNQRVRKQAPHSDGKADLDELSARLSKRLDSRYPAAGSILHTVKNHAALPFADALEVEADCFVQLARSNEAESLIGLFINDQLLKRKAKGWVQQAGSIDQAAVLGAGIMGGGIAYQSAVTGTPIRMKDITDEALALGCKTAERLLAKQVEKGRLSTSSQQQIQSTISPVLTYEGFGEVDLVVEAVVENPAVKASVLAEVEKSTAQNTVLASNTSTISINQLAQGLERPEKFCGMHFFNPVHQMPLVEVIRGEQTADYAIARTVAYAISMGKTPIVVNDCPGFLVNRILFPYFNGFNRLLLDGVDFQRIDQVMERFGWPMGPAFLADVIGLDIMAHADQVLQEGYPERMEHDGDVIIELLLAEGHLGQKNGKGFYEYGIDEAGRRNKKPGVLASKLTAQVDGKNESVSDQEIIDRMMIPMCLEAVRCLEDGVVETAAEVDMGLVLGLGFPRFRGGALRYIQTIGIEAFCTQADRYLQHGALYQVTDGLRQKTQTSDAFYC